ncbi:MAG: selenide, water dikinase SelD [Bacteroidetes bacterium]|nr:selenide, water dikinase SelD [Bacteroidota bacterium]
MEAEKIRLTQFSKGSGCGCKIAPESLETLLNQLPKSKINPYLIIGNENRDDAAVYDLGNDRYLISTVDFFTPIVDDAFDFGRIAAANAISDVYAMGGKPLFATAVFGWPVDKLPIQLGSEVLRGGRTICDQAGIVIAGGHSVDLPEPVFGLSVIGEVNKSHLKTNGNAQPGDRLFVTKPIGTGMLSTAMKRGIYNSEELKPAIDQMTTLNSIGEFLGRFSDVHALTDITGFGLLGHLLEMCNASNTSAEVVFDLIPLLLPEKMDHLINSFVFSDNTMRNYKAHHPFCSPMDGRKLGIMCDPQTNGGLLISVQPDFADTLIKEVKNTGSEIWEVGRMKERGELVVELV